MVKKTSKAVMSVKRFMAIGLAVSMLFTCGISASAEPLDADVENTTVTVEDGSADEDVSGKNDTETSTENGADGKETSTENGVDETETPDGNEVDEENADKNPAVNGEAADNSATDEDALEEAGIEQLSDESGDGDGTLLPATNLRWSEEKPGTAVFHNPNDSNVGACFYVFRDGQGIGYITSSVTGEQDCTYFVPSFINDSGTYTFQVELFGYGVEPDYDLSSGCVSEVSPGFVYTRPSEQVSVPSNITWSADGVISWDSVEHVWSYSVSLYRKEADDSYKYVGGYGGSQTSCDFKDELAEGYEYAVRVRAISENIMLYANGETSDYIPFDNSSSVEDTDNKLDAAIGSDAVTTDNVGSVVERVKNSFSDAASKGELQVAMQTDSGTQTKIEELENTYSSAMNLNIEVNPAEETGINASSVKLLGAALNATQSGTVTFNMSKPDEDTQKDLITNSRFSKAIVLDLGLEGAGITRGEELAIPVTVTMNAPEGIDINKLAILHYNADNTAYETIPVRKNADGTISFTVTHFSNFVFGEKTEDTETSADGTNMALSSDGMYTASSGAVTSSDGSSSNGNVAPAWKPTTPDEKKRYEAMGRERVEYTVSAASTYTVKMVNAMQGKLCFDVFETVLGNLNGYKIGRTYNILPSGMIVYKMEKAATITLTIPKALQAAGREFKMICVTKGGQPIVLDDTDSNPNTITFTTDSYYAFALIYKDAAAK